MITSLFIFTTVVFALVALYQHNRLVEAANCLARIKAADSVIKAADKYIGTLENRIEKLSKSQLEVLEKIAKDTNE